MTCGSNSFRFRSSFLNTEWYEVQGPHGSFTIAFRRDTDSYERSIFNGNQHAWETKVVAAVGCVYRSPDPSAPLNADLVGEFNAWRLRQHQADLDKIDSQPARYGQLDPDSPLRRPPAIASGAYWTPDAGWIKAQPQTAITAAAA